MSTVRRDLAMRRSDLEKTAIHEAGHAVACVLLDLEFNHATIIPGDDAKGHVDITMPGYVLDEMENGDPLTDPKTRQHLEHHLIAILAGPIAQRKKFPRSRLNSTDTLKGLKVLVPGSDHSQVTRMIADLFGADNDQVRWTYERYITARARALVESHWHEFELIAAALLERETLAAEEISRLIYQARSDGLPALHSAAPH